MREIVNGGQFISSQGLAGLSSQMPIVPTEKTMPSAVFDKP